MSENLDENLMQDHEYDGIQELDNDLPFWWVALFIFTVIIGVVYICYYTMDMGPGQEGEYAMEMARIEETKKQKERTAMLEKEALDKQNRAAGIVVEEEPEGNFEVSDATIANGKKIFGKHCFSCHGMKGEGLVGPNMTDNFFIHGPTLEDAVNIITVGVPAKGMLPWKGMLSKKDIFDVATFVHSLKGQNLPSPKPPEGKEYKD